MITRLIVGFAVLVPAASWSRISCSSLSTRSAKRQLDRNGARLSGTRFGDGVLAAGLGVRGGRGDDELSARQSRPRAARSATSTASGR